MSSNCSVKNSLKRLEQSFGRAMNFTAVDKFEASFAALESVKRWDRLSTGEGRLCQRFVKLV